MTCFNPKYVQYTYKHTVPTKIKQKLIEQFQLDKDYNKFNKQMFDNAQITKVIKFQTKKDFDESKIGNGSMIIPCGRCLRLFIR